MDDFSGLPDGMGPDLQLLESQIFEDGAIEKDFSPKRTSFHKGVCSISFKSELSPEEKSILDAKVASHLGSLGSLRIGRYLTPKDPNMGSPPFDLDFGKLAPKLHKMMGMRNESGYVTRWDWVPVTLGPAGGELGDAVVREYHIPHIDPVTGAPIFREERIEWMLEDGTAHPQTKNRIKFYVTDNAETTAKAIAKEGQKRRGALLDEAIGAMGGFLVDINPGDFASAYAIGQEFINSLGLTLEKYVRDTNPEIINRIGDADGEAFPWLDSPKYFDSKLATPVRDGSPDSGVMVSAREYLMGILDVYRI